MWVVRTSACEILVTIAFCRPMMKHSTAAVAGTSSALVWARLAPSRPKASSSSASNSRLSANSLCMRRLRAQLISTVVVIAPLMNTATSSTPASARPPWPSARSSTTPETMPVMCEV